MKKQINCEMKRKIYIVLLIVFGSLTHKVINILIELSETKLIIYEMKNWSFVFDKNQVFSFHLISKRWHEKQCMPIYKSCVLHHQFSTVKVNITCSIFYSVGMMPIFTLLKTM